MRGVGDGDGLLRLRGQQPGLPIEGTRKAPAWDGRGGSRRWMRDMLRLYNGLWLHGTREIKCIDG
jgi:hypothetical protein